MVGMTGWNTRCLEIDFKVHYTARTWDLVCSMQNVMLYLMVLFLKSTFCNFLRYALFLNALGRTVANEMGDSC